MEQDTSLWGTVFPALGSILSGVLSVGIPYALLLFTKYTGIRVEEKHMQVLHSAILTGASWAVSKYGPEAARNHVMEVIEYARRSSPDAFAFFTPGAATLEQLVLGKIEQIINPSIHPVIR